MRLPAALALTVALVTGGCATPDGQFDAGNTLALGAGLAALGGLVYLATQDSGPRHHYAPRGGHRSGGWSHGVGRSRGWR